MSYCRWSEDSDVYVFESVDGGWECCGCLLDSGKSYATATRQGMIEHLDVHRGSGHKVPALAVARLIEERDAERAGLTR